MFYVQMITYTFFDVNTLFLTLFYFFTSKKFFISYIFLLLFFYLRSVVSFDENAELFPIKIKRERKEYHPKNLTEKGIISPEKSDENEKNITR